VPAAVGRAAVGGADCPPDGVEPGRHHRHPPTLAATRVAALGERPRSGRPPRVTGAYRRELRRALRVGPQACGYVFTVWSIARLAQHLQQVTGIALSVNGLRRVVRAEGFAIGRPKHTLKNKRDEQEYRRARRRLERLKRGP